MAPAGLKLIAAFFHDLHFAPRPGKMASWFMNVPARLPALKI